MEIYDLPIALILLSIALTIMAYFGVPKFFKLDKEEDEKILDNNSTEIHK